MKNVLVLSAAAGAGHVRAAEAMVKALSQRDMDARHVECLKYTTSVFRKLYADLYIGLANSQPGLLGMLYDSLDKPWKFRKRRLGMDRINIGPLIKMLRQSPPDYALCTHFLPAELMLYLRERDGLDIPVGVVVTDIDAHAMWLYKGVDQYFVAMEETRQHIAALGVPIDTIHTTGIPIDPLFAAPLDKRATRKALGLAPKRTTLLVSAGGFGVGPVEAIIEQCMKVRKPLQLVVICGKNERLHAQLSQIKDTPHPLTVIGFTTQMDEWMAAADIMVGKPGGLTSAEALARGLVLFIVNPIPGQEERNSDHFLEEGAALRCNNLPAFAYKLEALLGDVQRFERMKQNALRIARPNAAADIAGLVASRIS